MRLTWVIICGRLRLAGIQDWFTSIPSKYSQQLETPFVALRCLENGMTHGRMLLLLLIALASLLPREAGAGGLQEEQQCLAMAIYWEARGEGRQGMVAVGWTIINRTRSDHFPKTPCAVVYQGNEWGHCQFSWWCDGKSDRPTDRKNWTKALITAAEMIVNPPRDPTNGALFYHSINIPRPWVRKRTRTARVGQHIFYR
jgi:N-acetylmuramoyl-L-alanine amidase